MNIGLGVPSHWCWRLETLDTCWLKSALGFVSPQLSQTPLQAPLADPFADLHLHCACCLP